MHELACDTDPIGTILDDVYRVDEWLAEGGMATIYRGTQLLLERPVAIKVMRGDLRRDPEARLRFERELQLSRTVSHPNVVRVYDGGVDERGRIYLIMEFLTGETLDRRVPEEGLALEHALELFVQLCDGVEAIHEAGLLHRDLKPSNVFLCRGRTPQYAGRRAGKTRVKVLDFGLVRRVDDRAATSLTKDRRVLGTAGYLAPEQVASDRPPDPRADVYALGALLAFMLLGDSPFASSSSTGTLNRQLFEGPSPELLERLPQIADLRRVIEKALAREPVARFASVAALREAVLELELPGATPELVARLVAARPGMPRESEFHTDAIPLDDLDEPERVIDGYPAPLRLMAVSVLDVLRRASAPLSTAEVRDRLRHETTLDIDAYVRVLETLADDGLVSAGAGSWRLMSR